MLQINQPLLMKKLSEYIAEEFAYCQKLYFMIPIMAIFIIRELLAFWFAIGE